MDGFDFDCPCGTHVTGSDHCQCGCEIYEGPCWRGEPHPNPTADDVKNRFPLMVQGPVGTRVIYMVDEERPYWGRYQQIYIRFPNGYGVSVVRSDKHYGGKEGLWELAVMKFCSCGVCTPYPHEEWDIVGDVTGWLTPEGVARIAREVVSREGG